MYLFLFSKIKTDIFVSFSFKRENLLKYFSKTKMSICFFNALIGFNLGVSYNFASQFENDYLYFFSERHILFFVE